MALHTAAPSALVGAPRLSRRQSRAAPFSAAAAAPASGAASEEEVSIRRAPPGGSHKLDVGSNFDFLLEALDEQGNRVPAAENKPRNILEEIVWHKAVEIARVRLPLSWLHQFTH